MKKHLFALVAGLALLMSVAVLAQDYGGYGTSAKTTTATAAGTLMATVESDSTLALFVKHVNKAGLAQALQSSGPVTVFAPDNKAFNGRSKEDLDAEHKDAAVLLSTMKYHVLTGKALSAADLTAMNGQTLTMDNGMQLKVTARDGKIMIGNAQVLRSDIKAGSGVIHVIDRVEIPGKVGNTASMPGMTPK